MAAQISDGNLPPLVRRYLDRCLPSGGNVPRMVRLTQAGELRLKPDGRWLRFTANQESLVQEVSFSWQARVRMLPLISVQVVDRFSAGEGSGEVRLFGLVPIMRDSGSHVSQGAALRYLAELPWNPHAMLTNTSLLVEVRQAGQNLRGGRRADQAEHFQMKETVSHCSWP